MSEDAAVVGLGSGAGVTDDSTVLVRMSTGHLDALKRWGDSKLAKHAHDALVAAQAVAALAPADSVPLAVVLPLLRAVARWVDEENHERPDIKAARMIRTWLALPAELRARVEADRG